MDKIQAAIAKARAARDEVAPKPAVVAGTPAEKTRPATKRSQIIRPLADRSAIWQTLPIFTLPARQMARQRIVTFGGGVKTAPGAAEFDMLRTKILQLMRANDWKRLAITSPGADCGKSTVALNLAFSLSKQPEIYTIVGEMDMRRPSLSKTLGLSDGINFATVLEGKTPFGDVAMRPRPNLAFAVNNSRVRNPSELLQSSSIEPVLDDIEFRYKPDLMIFDMPPMLHSDDTLAFMDVVDCVLLVAAAETTSLAEIDVCERELAEQTNVLGVLLNKCRYMDKDFGKAGYD